MQHRLGTALRAYRDTRLESFRRHRERVMALGERALRAVENLLDNRDLRLEGAGQLLTAFSYRGVLERGFALVRDGSGNPLRRAAAVQAGQALDIEFADGRAQATAQGAPALAPVVPARPRRRRRIGSGEGQGNLFDP
jgi:exodeoxyribonuclease VII large subunit